MQPTTEDERVLAALSHASIIANVANLAGMIATSLIWTMQRDRSDYVRAHALQALIYQGAVLLIAIFLGLFGGICVALSLLPAMLRPDLYRSSLPSYSVWIGVLVLVGLVGFGVLSTLYGLYGAYQVYHGRSFRYPLIGRLTRPRPLAEPSSSAPAAGPTQAAETTHEPSAPAEPAATAPSAPPEAAPGLPAEAAPPTTQAPTMPKRSRRRPPTDGES